MARPEICFSGRKRYYRLMTGILAILSPMKTIVLTLSAAKDLDGLPRDAREQVEAGLQTSTL
jgi:hypothetical protein